MDETATNNIPDGWPHVSITATSSTAGDIITTSADDILIYDGSSTMWVKPPVDELEEQVAMLETELHEYKERFGPLHTEPSSGPKWNGNMWIKEYVAGVERSLEDQGTKIETLQVDVPEYEEAVKYGAESIREEIDTDILYRMLSEAKESPKKELDDSERFERAMRNIK